MDFGKEFSTIAPPSSLLGIQDGESGRMDQIEKTQEETRESQQSETNQIFSPYLLSSTEKSFFFSPAPFVFRILEDLLREVFFPVSVHWVRANL